MFTYQHKLRVRYGDTDQMGFVYYGNYGYYYEQARAEAIRHLGITYREIELSGITMPVTRMNIKFIQPAVYDEMLTIRTSIPHLPNRIIIFQYEVINERGKRINEGETHLAFINKNSGKIQAAPFVLLDKLKPYF